MNIQFCILNIWLSRILIVFLHHRLYKDGVLQRIAMKPHILVIVVPPYPQCRFLQFQLPTLNGGPEAADPLLTLCQKVNNSLMLLHHAYIVYLTSFHHVGVSHQHQKGNSTVRHPERHHTHITFITMYCYHCSIISYCC